MEEDPRKNLSAKLRLEKSVKQFFKKIDKYIKASIACSENAVFLQLNSSYREKHRKLMI